MTFQVQPRAWRFLNDTSRGTAAGSAVAVVAGKATWTAMNVLRQSAKTIPNI